MLLAWPTAAWVPFVLGWLTGALVRGVWRRGRPWPLPPDLPAELQLKVLQAVHDDPVVDNVDVARGVLSYLDHEPRRRRRGPGWLYVILGVSTSVLVGLITWDELSGASLVRLAVAEAAWVALIAAASVDTWRRRGRADAAEAAARDLLAVEGP